MWEFAHVLMRKETEEAVAAILERYPDDPYAIHLTQELWKMLEMYEGYGPTEELVPSHGLCKCGKWKVLANVQMVMPDGIHSYKGCEIAPATCTCGEQTAPKQDFPIALENIIHNIDAPCYKPYWGKS
jgi:hypothetical protein